MTHRRPRTFRVFMTALLVVLLGAWAMFFARVTVETSAGAGVDTMSSSRDDEPDHGPRSALGQVELEEEEQDLYLDEAGVVPHGPPAPSRPAVARPALAWCEGTIETAPPDPTFEPPTPPPRG